MLILFTLSIVYAITPENVANNLPSTIPRCHLNDPKLNDCLLQAAITLQPLIRDGIKELGIPPYEPRVIPYFSVVQETNLTNFAASVQNMTIRGMENYDMTEIRYDPVSMTFSGKLEFDPLSINTKYEVNGTVISIPLRGNGIAHVALGPIHATFKISGKMKKRKNVAHYDPIDVDIKLTIEDTSVYFDGLFDEDPELGSTANELINRNSKLFVKAVTPAFEQISAEFIARYVKWLAYKFPYYYLFPRAA